MRDVNVIIKPVAAGVDPDSLERDGARRGGIGGGRKGFHMGCIQMERIYAGGGEFRRVCIGD